MHAALVIAAKDLLQRSRDRSAYIMGLVGPLCLVFILDATLGNVDGASRFEFALVNQDSGDLGVAFDELFDGLVADGVVDGRRFDDRDALDQAIDDGETQAGFVLAEGFTEQVRSGQEASLTVVGDRGSPVAVSVAEAIASGFATEVDYVGAVTALTLGSATARPDPAELAALGEQALAIEPPVVLTPAETVGRGYDNSSYFAVSMSVFFLFFTVQFGVLSLLSEQEEGTLGRLLVAPISPTTVLAGKLVSSMVVGLGTMTVLVAATTLVVGAEWGGLVPVALLVVVGVLVAIALATVVGGLSRTAEQAGAFSSILAVVLGLLGGAFFPLSEGPGVLNIISYLSPHRWLLDGFRDVSYGAGVADLTEDLAVLALFVVVIGGVGLVLSGRRMVRS